jgi:hypothetical protein
MFSSKQSLKRQSSLSSTSEKPAKQAKSEPSQRTPLQPISNNLSTLATASTSASAECQRHFEIVLVQPTCHQPEVTCKHVARTSSTRSKIPLQIPLAAFRWDFYEDTRPVMDKHYNSILLSKLASADTVTRYSPYAIAMMQAQQLLPAYEPPALPAKFRQFTKRNGKDTEKEATWVVSHLCHNKRCVC